jgi:transcriptional regulator with XRE-family HTH domain
MEALMKLDAEKLKRLRESRGWSQEHLAGAAGLSVRTVQRAESEGSASRESKMCLAAALGVPHADLELAVQTIPATQNWSTQAIHQHIHKVLGGTFLMLGAGFGGIQLILRQSPSPFGFLCMFFLFIGTLYLFLAFVLRRSAGAQAS